MRFFFLRCKMWSIFRLSKTWFIFFCHYSLHLKWFHLNYRNNCEIQIAFYEKFANFKLEMLLERLRVCVCLSVSVCLWVELMKEHVSCTSDILVLMTTLVTNREPENLFKLLPLTELWHTAATFEYTIQLKIVYELYFIWMWIASIQRIVWIQLILYALRMF